MEDDGWSDSDVDEEIDYDDEEDEEDEEDYDDREPVEELIPEGEEQGEGEGEEGDDVEEEDSEYDDGEEEDYEEREELISGRMFNPLVSYGADDYDEEEEEDDEDYEDEDEDDYDDSEIGDDEDDYEDEDEEDYEEEVEEVETMLPRVSNSTANGRILEEAVVIRDLEHSNDMELCEDKPENQENCVAEELNRGENDGLICPICFEAWTSGGDHQICCLPCGHLYGFSCIKKWLQRSPSSGKCPQCNRLCRLKDVRVLYTSRLSVADQELHKKVHALEAKCASLEQQLSLQTLMGSVTMEEVTTENMETACAKFGSELDRAKDFSSSSSLPDSSGPLTQGAFEAWKATVEAHFAAHESLIDRLTQMMKFLQDRKM